MYKSGYKIVNRKIPFEDFPRAVNESAKHQFRSDQNYFKSGDVEKFLETYKKLFSKGLESPYAAK